MITPLYGGIKPVSVPFVLVGCIMLFVIIIASAFTFPFSVVADNYSSD